MVWRHIYYSWLQTWPCWEFPKPAVMMNTFKILPENVYFMPCNSVMVRFLLTLQWRHNERDGISDHQPHDCLFNCLFRHRSKKTSKPLVTGLCAGNSLVTSEFSAQRASNEENVSIWWHHRGNFDIQYGAIIAQSIFSQIFTKNIP